MKKRSIAGRLGVLALALTLVTTSLSSGTLAKYTTTKEYTGLLKVAQWNPSVKMTTPTGAQMCTDTTTFALSDTFSFTAGPTLIKPKEIAPGTEGYFCVMVDAAPDNGGSGSTEKPTDVAVDYRITIEGVNNTEAVPPLFFMKQIPEKTGSNKTVEWSETDSKFVVDPTALQTLRQSAADAVNITADAQELAKGVINASATNNDAEKLVWIYWFWPYETKGENYQNAAAYNDGSPAAGTQKMSGDKIDTYAGIAAAAVDFKLTVDMVQHDPRQPLTASSKPNTYWDYALDASGNPKAGYQLTDKMDIETIYPGQTAATGG